MLFGNALEMDNEYMTNVNDDLIAFWIFYRAPRADHVIL